MKKQIVILCSGMLYTLSKFRNSSLIARNTVQVSKSFFLNILLPCILYRNKNILVPFFINLKFVEIIIFISHGAV